MKIGILGASGFISSKLISNLSRDFSVFGYSSSFESKESNISLGRFEKSAELNEFLLSKDVLIFSAGPTNPHDIGNEQANKLNDVLDYIIEAFFENNQNGLFIHISSAGALYKVCEDEIDESFDMAPTTTYGLIKQEQEDLIFKKYFDKKIVILRPANIYGDPKKKNRKTGIIDLAIDTISSNGKVNVFSNLNSSRDYLFIDDFVNLVKNIILSKKLKSTLEVYNVSSHERLSLKKIFSEIEDVFKTKLNLEINEKTNCDHLNVNSQKARDTFNWSPNENFNFNLKKIKSNLEGY